VEEAYYFAAQKMTKVMNEGWAAYWESTMMTDEAFAGDDEFLNYADHMAKVLASGGLNPYSLGMELWEYVENTTNRREVLEALLRVEGVSWRNLTEVIDFDEVLDGLEPPAAIETITPATLDSLEAVSDEWVDREALERAREPVRSTCRNTLEGVDIRGRRSPTLAGQAPEPRLPRAGHAE